MIAPLMFSTFRGVIWYQGESNAWRPKEYRGLLSSLIESWRIASHQDDMQFLIVQLPNHGAIPVKPGESAWAEVREAELVTAKQVPDTGLAVTIDVGDPKTFIPIARQKWARDSRSGLSELFITSRSCLQARCTKR